MVNNTEKLLKERQVTHGDYLEVARIAQAFRELMRNTHGWKKMNNAQRESLDSMASKFGRLGSGGNPHFRDHWDDLAGYATLASFHCNSDIDTVVKDVEERLKEVVSSVSLKGDKEVMSLPKIVSKSFFSSSQPEEQQQESK